MPPASMVCLVVACVGTGCGRVRFEPGTDASDPDGTFDGPFGDSRHLRVEVSGNVTVVSTPPGIDCPGVCDLDVDSGTNVALTATVPTNDWFRGWTGACDGRGTCTVVVDNDTVAKAVASALPNRLFLSSVTGSNLGGLAGADALCGGEAAAAGLTGEFGALLSTSTVNAADRMQGSRGWIRIDGTPVADSWTALTGGVLYNPPNQTADGTVAPSDRVWTGSNAVGDVGVSGTCNDWSGAGVSGSIGDSGVALPQFLEWGGSSCNSNHRLYCFERNRVVTVGPVPQDGRVAFLSSAPRSTAGPGLAGMDALCTSEANNSGLSGTFKAAAASTTSTIASRFASLPGPWRRPDGTRLADTTDELLNAPRLRSFINQHADGSYASTRALVVLGATSPDVAAALAESCDDWTLFSGGSMLLGEGAATDYADRWSSGASSCNSSWYVLCLESS